MPSDYDERLLLDDKPHRRGSSNGSDDLDQALQDSELQAFAKVWPVSGTHSALGLSVSVRN